MESIVSFPWFTMLTDGGASPGIDSIASIHWNIDDVGSSVCPWVRWISEALAAGGDPLAGRGGPRFRRFCQHDLQVWNSISRPRIFPKRWVTQPQEHLNVWDNCPSSSRVGGWGGGATGR